MIAAACMPRKRVSPFLERQQKRRFSLDNRPDRDRHHIAIMRVPMNLTSEERDQFETAAASTARSHACSQTNPAPPGNRRYPMRILALAGAFGLALVANSQIAIPQAEAFPMGPRYCAQYRGNAGDWGVYLFN